MLKKSPFCPFSKSDLLDVSSDLNHFQSCIRGYGYVKTLTENFKQADVEIKIQQNTAHYPGQSYSKGFTFGDKQSIFY
jgi:hypothetical protein